MSDLWSSKAYFRAVLQYRYFSAESCVVVLQMLPQLALKSKNAEIIPFLVIQAQYFHAYHF